MSQQLIFFDIDGTLLDHDKQLPESTRQAVQALKDKGHEVAIATGRAPFMFAKLRKELDIQTYVSYNGQYVVLQGRVIHTNPLDKQALQALTDIAVLHNHPIVYMDHEDMKANVPHHDYIVESIDTLKIDNFPAHDPHYFKEREIYQSLLFCQEKEEDFYEERFKQFDFIRWHPVSVDVIPAGGSKAKGIAKITQKLEIEPENVFAFGDGLNDIEMLKTVRNSIAMGNAHDLAKKAAKYITSSVDEDGILHGLQKVGLLD
ncbi:Cof-type HAD-IIB family hydrolase [Aneurinibacillus sp. Ricciae_BoGa-3]|uniref:Cof-type HAD-IIB family hydrolase n=1 Tax=Aneurinibacillus sp. Ricciae_BoGa-3 TaxID=3022697 RepID=UPI0023406885|nr:Cof-type HAD-IIB family hydrolase [Aneurinibacillus sp. Ricciae_BoGa-3]WCK56375.1 Cof-type HAD-IIB family hydrolase [Aneurinibacillus sp. Ricciae_BoGa-3]